MEQDARRKRPSDTRRSLEYTSLAVAPVTGDKESVKALSVHIVSPSSSMPGVRAPSPISIVTKILGDLQYEPTVKILLQQNRALRTSANIKDLHQRETALEAIRKIVTETPAARGDLEVLADKLAELDAQGAKDDGEVGAEDQAIAGANDDSQDSDEADRLGDKLH